MKLSLNLLKQFVAIKQSPEQLAVLLTERAFEVEGLQHSQVQFTNVISAKVERIEKHPNADRLRIIRLTDGERNFYPVVCGAYNFEEGAIVALALPGAHIPQNIHSEAHEGFTLEKAKIRGVESQGMICARFELGLSNEAEKGIWVLDPNTPLGVDVASLVPADTILEVSLPANRPDLHSHLGVAREIAAVLDLKVKQPKPAAIKSSLGKQPFKISISDKTLSSKFIAVCVGNINIQPSPVFIQETLQALGVRPINNVVDITNYVTLELGQPLHAFNSKAVAGNMTVRAAKPKETLTAINHKDYVLDPTIAVIADDDKALDIAGIMGGLDSEVNQETKKIILTANIFNPEKVRLAAKRLGLRTEASSLFEKSVHPFLADLAINRAIELLSKYAEGRVDQISIIDNSKVKPISINFTAEQINGILGTDYKAANIKKALQRYGVAVTGANKMNAVPPWWRTDLTAPEDLAEEVLKGEGINTVKPQALTTGINPEITEHSLARSLRSSKEFWARLGYFEVQNYSFVSKDDIDRFGEAREHIAVANPLSQDQAFMKRHLLIPLLKNVRLNQTQGSDFRLFEIGKQYLDFGREPLLLAGVSYSKTQSLQEQLNSVKGDCLQYLRSLGLDNISFAPANELWAEVKVNRETVGLVGILQKEIVNNFDIDRQLAWFKLELEKLLDLQQTVAYTPMSKFPPIERDISIIIEQGILWSDIEKLLQGSDLLQRASVFEADYLGGDKSAQTFHADLAKGGFKNLGIRLVFQAPDRTLTEGEITGILDQIMLKLRQELNAEIR
jgi:phenylalanyl-tRNA synthetase beta chain